MARSILENAYLFKSLSPTEAEAISALTETKTYHDGDLVFTKGDVATGMYFIKYGSVRIQHAYDSGDSLDIAILSSGSHFGEMGFVDAESRSATAVALEHTEIIVMPYEKLAHFLELHPGVALKFYRELAHFLCRRLRVTSSDLTYAREKNLSHF